MQLASLVKMEAASGDYWVLRCAGKMIYVGKVNKQSVQVKKVEDREYVYIVGRPKNDTTAPPLFLYLGRLMERKKDSKILRILISDEVLEKLVSEKTRDGRKRTASEGESSE